MEISRSEPKKNSRINRQQWSLLIALAFVFVGAVGCINDLEPQGGWSSPVVEDGKFYLGNRDGNLVRFKPESDSVDLNWRYPREDGLGAIYSSPIIVGDHIFGAGYTCRGNKCDGEVFGLDIAGGNSIWGQRGLELSTKLVGPIGIVDSTLLVGTGAISEEDGGPDGYLYGIDTSANSSSLVKWRIPLDGNAWSGVAVDGSSAYVATMSGTVYAINASDEERFALDPLSRIQWTFSTGSAIAGPLHVDGGSIFFGDLENNAYKLRASVRSSVNSSSDIDRGSGEWKFDTGTWVWAKPIVEGGVVYVSGLDGSIHALDEDTGSEKWSASVDGQIVASPTLFDRKRGDTRERALAVPSGDRNVWVISVIDGRELGVFVTDEPVKAKPVVYENLLYVHSMNGELKWFSLDDASQRGCVDLKEGGRCG